MIYWPLNCTFVDKLYECTLTLLPSNIQNIQGRWHYRLNNNETSTSSCFRWSSSNPPFTGNLHIYSCPWIIHTCMPLWFYCDTVFIVFALVVEISTSLTNWGLATQWTWSALANLITAWYQAIIRAQWDFLQIRPMWTNSSTIRTEMNLSMNKIYFKLSSAKWQEFVPLFMS